MVAACPFPAARGTPLRIFHQANELAQRGHQVDVITYHLGDGVEDARFGVHRIPDVPTYRRRAPGPTLQKLLVVDPLLALKLASVLRSNHYDVIHAHHFEGLLTALSMRPWFHIPVVFDAHTTLAAELPFYSPHGRQLLSRLGRALDSHLPARSNHVIAVSDEVRANLTERYSLPPHRVSVIPNGVEEDFFTEPADLAEPPHVVFAGNLAAYQGIDLLLAAFARSLKRIPELRLKIVSDSGFAAYEGLAAELDVRDHIDLVSVDLEELPSYLAGATALLNPRPDGDGTPQKVLNYMASGRPIVSFSGSARHLVDGHNALVVQSGDVGAFSQAILRLCADPQLAHRLGERARRTARSELSWTRTAARIEDVYAQLMRPVTAAA